MGLTYLEDYNRDGYAVIPSVFTKEEMDGLRVQAWHAFKQYDTDIQWKNRLFPALMFWPRTLGHWRLSSELKNIVKSVLGDGDIIQLNHQYYFRLPGDGDQFNWHQDITFRTPVENFIGIEDGYLQTAIIVDDMDISNGGIQFIPGSHKHGDLELIERGTEKGLREEPITQRSAFCPEVKSGDVMIWHVLTTHGSDKNESKRYRSYLMNGFAKAECVIDKSGYPYYIKESTGALVDE